MTANEIRYLRYAIMIADRARDHGNPPFGAVLVSSRGWILCEGESTQGKTHDCTSHAETNLLREATQRFSPKLLSHSILYTSSEPCPMCAGAIFWSGVGRVVYGLSSDRLRQLTRDRTEQLFEHCSQLLSRGTHHVDVEGPLLEEEAEEVFKKAMSEQHQNLH